jgi:hypothetical protein
MIEMPEQYSLISDSIIESVIAQVNTMRRAANRMNESDGWQATTALDNIEGMMKHNLYECNVSPNIENATNVLDRMSESLEVDDA